MQVPNSPSKL